MRTPVALFVCLVVSLAVMPLYADQLVNPGFEDGTTGWSVIGTASTPTEVTLFGTTVYPTEEEHFLWLHQPPENSVYHSATQSVVLAPGERIRGYYRFLSDGTAGASATLSVGGSLEAEWDSQDGSTDWLEWEYTAQNQQQIAVIFTLWNFFLPGDEHAAAFLDANPLDTYIPEPTSVATGLSALAMLGLGLYRRRRRT